MIFYRIFYKIYKIIAKRMCADCSDFIKNGSEVLDLGCGSGIVGKNFADFFKSKITGVDIADKRIVHIDFQLYNGKNLPFGSDSFDVVLISYVLHHCQDQIFTLREAKRVVKNKIIIYEDLPENFFFKFVCRIHGISFAYFFQKNKEFGVFNNDNKWKKIFDGLDLKLIFEKKVGHFGRRKMFVLEKTRA